MRLSVTQRLTLTSILLSGAVLVPAILAVQLATRRSIVTDATAFATDTAQHAADAVLAQWDEEFLVEFGAGSVTFRDLKVGLLDWALSRPNGTVEWAGGTFVQGFAAEVSTESRLITSREGKSWRLASVPLIAPAQIRLEDLAAAVREGILRENPGGECLSIRREMAGAGFAYEVKFLDGAVIRAVKIAPDGSVVRRSREALPAGLPADLISVLSSRGESISAGELQWRQHEGQLLAVVTVGSPGTPAVATAVNRVGERFHLGPGSNDVVRDEASRIFLTVAVDATTEKRTLASLRVGLWLGGSIVWGFLSLAGWFVARRAMQPVQDIVNAVTQIGVDRLDARLPVAPVEDELARIAATINGMLSRLEAGYRRERELTADASHELRTPLSKVIGEIDLSLNREREAGEYRETLIRCRGYAEGMQRLVEALLLLARLDSGAAPLAKSPLDLGALAAEAISLLPTPERERITLSLGESHEPFLAQGEKHLVQTVLRNLLENALRYSPPDTRVTVEVLAGGRDRVVVRVVDRGPGIHASVRDRIFDRFFRLEDSRARHSGGLGLGLAIARAIARAHDGDVVLAPGQGGGTVATLSLPAP